MIFQKGEFQQLLDERNFRVTKKGQNGAQNVQNLQRLPPQGSKLREKGLAKLGPEIGLLKGAK